MAPPGVLIQGLLVVILWVGAWGMIEMIIDDYVQENKRARFVTYFVLAALAILGLWALTQVIE
jgi:hypothetical protein